MTDQHDPGDTGKDGKHYRLTPKQEAFCLAYVETGNASEAYRRAYPRSETWTDGAVWTEASVTLHVPKVALRIVELMTEAAKRHETTIDSLTLQLCEDRKLAHDKGQAGAAVQATMGEAKLHGHLVDKHEDVGKDLDDLSPAELAADIAELDRKLIKAMPEADLEAHAIYLQEHLAETQAELASRRLAVVGDAGAQAGASEGRDALPSGAAALTVVED